MTPDLKKRTGLYLLLAVALMAAYFAPPEDGVLAKVPERIETAQPAMLGHGGRMLPATSAGPTSIPDADAILLALRQRPAALGDTQTWSVFDVSGASPTVVPSASAAQPALSEPSPAPPAIAPSPQAPPLPFRLLGWSSEEGRDQAFLMLGEQNLIVSAGDMVGKDYRVDRVGQGMVAIVYLPLGVIQTLEANTFD